MFEHVVEGVRWIPGKDKFLPDSHMYVVGKPESDDFSLVDCGLMEMGAYKLEGLESCGIPFDKVKRIIMTHTHLDHIGCFPNILKKIPEAELWVHTLEATALEKGDERTVYGMDMFKTMCQAQYGLKPGVFSFQVHHKLEGSESLNIGGMDWEVLHIPGHSMGSIALYHRAKKILIPGDVIYADHAIGRFDLHGANASDLKKSLLRLAELEVDILLPGHNQIVKNLPKGYIQKTARQWDPYLV